VKGRNSEMARKVVTTKAHKSKPWLLVMGFMEQ
jgi:hypothetical protein